MRVTVDEAGRVQLPEDVREQLGLGPGSEVDVEVADGAIEITPAGRDAYLECEGGHWVIVTPASAGTITAKMTNRMFEELRSGIRDDGTGL